MDKKYVRSRSGQEKPERTVAQAFKIASWYLEDILRKMDDDVSDENKELYEEKIERLVKKLERLSGHYLKHRLFRTVKVRSV